MPRRRETAHALAGACLAAACLGLLSACDFPTTPPEWETTWAAPGDSMFMAVSSLLPSMVSVTDDGSAFVLSLTGVDFSSTLGDLCANCQALDGEVVPKPAFASSFSSTVDLPADVISATLVSGALELRITNGFGFDPIRPSAASPARGMILVTIMNGSAVLATDTLAGAQVDFAPGTSRTLRLEFAPGVVAGPIGIEVLVESPAGDPVTIDAGQTIAVSVSTDPLLISEIEVAVADKAVAIDSIAVDLTGAEGDMLDRIRDGALRLSVHNPFAVAGALTLDVTTPTMIISKSLQVDQGDSSRRLDFTGDELRAVVGKRTTFGATGTLSAPSGTVTLEPTQELMIKVDLEVTLGPKGG